MKLCFEVGFSRFRYLRRLVTALTPNPSGSTINEPVAEEGLGEGFEGFVLAVEEVYFVVEGGENGRYCFLFAAESGRVANFDFAKNGGIDRGAS